MKLKRWSASTGSRPAAKDGGEIGGLQLRIVVRDFLFRHACCQPTEYVPDGDAQTAKTRLPGAFAGLDRDSAGHDARIASVGARDDGYSGHVSAGGYFP